MRLKKIFFLNIVFFNFLAFAGVTEEWVARYSLVQNTNEPISIVSDKSGNTYVTGFSYIGGRQIVTIKYNTTGNRLWAIQYISAGSIGHEPCKINIDNEDNIYVVGTIIDSGPNNNILVIKYNSQGALMWSRKYIGPGNSYDRAQNSMIDKFGYLYVTGESNNDVITIKYTLSGDTVWTKLYNGPANNYDFPKAVTTDDSGNVFITGSVNGTMSDIFTIKYNSQGTLQWEKIYSSNGVDVGKEIVVDKNGNVYLTGDDILGIITIKYSNIGTLLWTKTHQGNGGAGGYNIALDSSENIYVVGRIRLGGSTDDLVTIKYNENGDSLWVRRFDGSQNSRVRIPYMVLDRYGSIYVTTGSYKSGTYYDFRTVKYSSTGQVEWIQRYEGPGPQFNDLDVPTALTVDPSGNLYVTGYSTSVGGFNEYTTIKYSDAIGIHIISNKLPLNYNLQQNHPNPFNPSTKIKFSLPTTSFVKVSVFNSLGIEIVELINKKLEAGVYEADWEAANYPSGVYFYRLTTEKFAQTRKAVLIK